VVPWQSLHADKCGFAPEAQSRSARICAFAKAVSCINPNQGDSQSLEKFTQNKTLMRKHMNEVNVSVR
jgi:hypothetical protein